MNSRIATIARRTRETEIRLRLNLDGKGRAKIRTTIPFLDHMLELAARHGLMDLEIAAKGDTRVDQHHLTEDLGLCLGQALREALGGKRGIERYGQFLVPMDESLSNVAVDLSGRPYFVWNVRLKKSTPGGFDFDLLEEFFRAVAQEARINLHVNLRYGRNNHHIAESCFKGFGRAVGQAASPRAREKGVPSTKGRLH